MKKLNTSPISGMQELLPQEQAVFNKYKEAIREVYHRHGFLEIETPTIDRAEILFAKAGGETEKQIYKVIKTDESADDADQALRFDHTVPLARYVVEHESSLNFPFKVTQVGRNFRGERAQKGRFREFYQCDIDVIGRGTLAVGYDAEVIQTLIEALKKILPESKLRVRVSNRKLLTAFLEEKNLQEVAKDIFSIIDHSEKVPEEKTLENLQSLGIGDERVQEVLDFMKINGHAGEVSNRLGELGVDSALFEEGRKELVATLNTLSEGNVSGDEIVADMRIVRGLDYYTGTVFETILPDHPEIGSVCSGGRYENLAGLYTDQILPGVGGSIGLTRLFYVMSANGLIPEEENNNPVDLAIIPLSEQEEHYCLALARAYRATAGLSVDVVLSDKKLGDKMKYAAKVAKKAVVIGPEEIAEKQHNIKDLTTGGITASHVTPEDILNA